MIDDGMIRMNDLLGRILKKGNAKAGCDVLRVAIFCDEYDSQAKVFRQNRTIDLARSSSTSMGVNRRSIEGEVDEAMMVIRVAWRRDAPVGTAQKTLAYFAGWLARRGGWE